MVSRSRQISGLALGMLMLGSASSAFAQTKCAEINDGSPFQLSGARQYLASVGNAKPDEVTRALTSAVRVLTDDPAKINNEPGRQFLLLRTWAAYLQQPGAQYVQQRGKLGFTTNPQGTHNLLMAMDSSLKSLNQSTPKCAATFAVYKDKFFGEMLNGSIAALAADKLDSAKHYANTALVLAPNDPRAWNVLVAAYQKQQAEDSTMYAMEKVVSLAGTDTTPAIAKIRQQQRYNLAVMTLIRAQNGQGDKSQGLAKSKGLLEAYLKETPGDPSATQALARTLQASGDTTAMQAMFGDMLTSPDKFTYMQLFENASAAAASNRNPEAIKLFENGLAKNPNYRDALYNLANVYFTMKDAEKLMPVVDKLISVDPNSVAAWQLKAAAWQVRYQKEADPAKKKLYSDSLVAYVQKKNDLNPQLAVTQLMATKTGLSIKGNVQNTSAAAGSWTLKLEFLDKDSKVVATKDVAVGPVAPGSSVEFSASVEAPGAIAYRYAPMK